ncbi:MAG: GIY-YIG nuclease family protein [bacterium]|nr:GIY-YIG nuclease family protein [bacterium]
MKDWYVYIVRCSDTSLYVGITCDVEERILKHNSGKGAKYTRSRRPVEIVRIERQPNESHARKREMELKRFSKKEKENLLTDPPTATDRT